MKTMEERRLAAERHLHEAGDRGDLWDQDWPTSKVVHEVIRAAFPELFDGTAWIAPTAPTKDMVEEVWAAVVARYLSPHRPGDKRGGDVG